MRFVESWFADASTGVQRNILTAHDAPEDTPEEISRRTFMANATMTISENIGVVLAIPLVGSLIPEGGGSTGSWSAADRASQLRWNGNIETREDDLYAEIQGRVPPRTGGRRI